MDRTRAVIVGLAAILLVLSFLLVAPLLEFVLLAALLGYLLRPLFVRLRGYTGPRIAAGTLVFGSTVAIVLPTLYVMRTMAEKFTSFIRQLRRGELSFEEFEAWVLEETGVEIDIMEQIGQYVRDIEVGVINNAVDSVSRLTYLAIGLALTTFLLYYFLKDAEKFNRWLRATAPLPDHLYEELQGELDDMMRAMFVSHVLIAIVQGMVAGLGLIVTGIPDALFWTLVMIFLAVLPIIGSFLVWGPASIYLFVIEEPIAGTFLLVYGTVVVGLTDDFLRPIVIDRYTEKHLNPGVVVLGILGGVYLLGFIGIFFGPVIIGSLRTVLDVYREELVQSGEHDSMPPDPSDEDQSDGDPSTDHHGDVETKPEETGRDDPAAE